jgi:hypothetical protein
MQAQGDLDGALDILFEIRLCNDVSLYRRALVNLLIACIGDPEKHDLTKFAKETLELCDIIEAENMLLDIDDPAISKIKKHANGVLADVRKLENKLPPVDEDQSGEEEEIKATGDMKENVDEDQIEWSEPLTIPEDWKRHPIAWTIEGTYHEEDLPTPRVRRCKSQ